MSLKGSKTEENLKDAFAGESQANRRYLYFAQKADVEGYNDVSAVFRSTAEGETGHAHGHLEYLEEVGDPATGKPIGSTSDNLKAAIAGETYVERNMRLAIFVVIAAIVGFGAALFLMEEGRFADLMERAERTIFGTVEPEDGFPNPLQPATYGDLELESGFTTDPYSV